MAEPRCPDMWSDIILNVSVRIWGDEINIRISGLGGQQIALHNMGGPHLIN